MIYPIEENCKRCHKKEGNLNFKKFDFLKRKPQVHVMKPSSTSAEKAPKPTPTSSEEAKKPADTTSKK